MALDLKVRVRKTDRSVEEVPCRSDGASYRVGDEIKRYEMIYV